MATSSFKVRPLTPSDLPAMASVDVNANLDHPIVSCFSSAEASLPMFQARYEFLNNIPWYHFYVATVSNLPTPSDTTSDKASGEEEEEVVGFIGWKEGELEGEKREEKEFELEGWPEGTDLATIGGFLKANREHSMELGIEGVKGVAIIEILVISTAYQKQGIGAALVATVLKEVDRRGEKTYVRSSEKGKGLYEKFGWKVMEKFVVDFRQWGIERSYVNWDMMREVGGKGNKEDKGRWG